MHVSSLRYFRVFVLPGDAVLVVREAQKVPIDIGAVRAWSGRASSVCAAVEAAGLEATTCRY